MDYASDQPDRLGPHCGNRPRFRRRSHLQHRGFLEAERLKFLFGGGAEKPAGYVPEDA